MGQSSFNYQHANNLYEFPIYQYVIKEKHNSSLTTWKSKSFPFKEVLQSKMIVDTEQKLSAIFQTFKLRHQHLYLVSSLYLTCEQKGLRGCGQDYRGNIYYETTMTNLSKINDIPFNDSLHIYSVALKGFQILYRKYGYFDVFQDMFHICENGKVKIWCNSQIYKCAPQPYLLDKTGRQEDMLHKIFYLIDQNVDKEHNFSVKRQIQKKISEGLIMESFEDANYIFRLICRQKKWYTPEKLNCLASVSKQQMEHILMVDKQQIEKISPLHKKRPQKQVPKMNFQQQNIKRMNYSSEHRNNPLGSQATTSFRQRMASPPNFSSQQVIPQTFIQRSPSIQRHTSPVQNINKFSPPISIAIPTQPQINEKKLWLKNEKIQQQNPTIRFIKPVEQKKPQLKKISRVNINNQYGSRKQKQKFEEIPQKKVQNRIKTASSDFYYEVAKSSPGEPIKSSNLISSKSTKRFQDQSQNESLKVYEPQPFQKVKFCREEQYTDPRLMELLSSQDSNQQESKQTNEEQSKLIYSFNKKFQQNKTFNAKTVQETERTTSKKYNHSIDNDLWEDLLRMKKQRDLK